MITDYSENPYLQIPQKNNANVQPKDKLPKIDSIEKEDSIFGESVQSYQMKEESMESDQIPFLQIKPFHLKISEMGKLGDLEQEIFNELVKLKAEELKGKSREMFSSQDPNDMSYDRTIDIRDKIMRKFKFEQLKKKLLPSFRKETRKYIIEKRTIKDPNISVFDPNSTKMMNGKFFIPEFIEYLKGIVTHISKKKRVNRDKVKRMFKQLFFHEKKLIDHNYSKFDVNGDFESFIDSFYSKNDEHHFDDVKFENNIKERAAPPISRQHQRISTNLY